MHKKKMIHKRFYKLTSMVIAIKLSINGNLSPLISLFPVCVISLD